MMNLVRIAFFLTAVLFATFIGSTAGNVLVNGDFEEGSLDPWYKLGQSTSLALSTTENHSSGHSVLVSNRSKKLNGIRQDILGQVMPGIAYQLTVWTKLSNSASDKVKVRLFQKDGAGKKNVWLGSTTATNAEWTEMTRSFTLQVTGTLSRLELRINGPLSGVGFYLDNVVLAPEQVATTPAPITIAPVTPVSEVPSTLPSYAPSPSPSHSPMGSPSSEPSNVPSWSPSFEPSSQPSETPSALPLSLPSFEPSLEHSKIPSALPSSLPSFEPSLDPSETPSALPSRVPSSEPSLSMMPSPAPVIPTPAPVTSTPGNVLINGDFDGGSYDPWYAQGATLALSATESRSASSAYSVRMSDRTTGTWNGMEQDVMDKIVPGIDYQLTAWTKLANSASDRVKMTVKQVDRAGTNYIQVSLVMATDSEWTEMTGSFTLDVTGTLSKLELYIKGPQIGVNFYLDDVVLAPEQVTTMPAPVTPSPVSPTAFPPGPYIGAGESETVLIPEPPVPDLGKPRSDCPHLQSGLLDWHDPATWGGQVPARGSGQTTSLAYQSPTLTLPVDVTASGYYITYMHNNIIGNAASGGWSGFAFPVLFSPTGGPHKDLQFRPANRLSLKIDGNTAHSSGWWWYHAGSFYLGGSLYYDSDGTTLVYNAGRDQSHSRSPCLVDKCNTGDCNRGCYGREKAWNKITNSKAFLLPSVGLNSWSGRAEIIGFEAHDVGLGLEALAAGFWIDNMLVVCRTGEDLAMPTQRADKIRGDGFYWYDTAQEHIISRSTFRNCGYRAPELNQYDTSPSRGCDGNSANGCSSRSTVFAFLSHSDQHTPEIMQGTRDIAFENCGRRFRLHDFNGDSEPSTVSGCGQNWLDVDGTVSGLSEPTLIGSGLSDAGLWWKVESEVVHDPQGPLEFIKKNNGPSRGLGHIKLRWDDNIFNSVGRSACGNGNQAPCPALGHVRHYGAMFASDSGLPVTANSDIVGPVGGFGWLLTLDGGAPHTLQINEMEILPETPLILGIAYPPGTSFNITSHAAYCNRSPNQRYSCDEYFTSAGSAAQVRASNGNTYHFDNESGLLTIRIIMTPQAFTGEPDWELWDFNRVGKWDKGYALDRFERDGVFLPIKAYGPWLEIIADCPRNGAYCAQAPPAVQPQVCSSGYEQVAYDKCCMSSNLSICEYP